MYVSAYSMHFGDAKLVGSLKHYDAVHACDVTEGPDIPPRPHFPGKINDGGIVSAGAAAAQPSI